ncbi:LysR family transcriptional regulator [Pseudonocardia eucalypti]|uniref:LysR family transcriptional regulator n=1 Tax=Pseudonocardia eucalypti TaxID=648755 RepID=A0ABP9PZV6_9PSEU|nr:DNA-binding transcriptional LysR family regulator [Pseudonocardia eucalypti]
MLNLTRLQVLAAVAEHGSITAAAAALHYAQPSVSHHLARLEAETGAVLVQRVGRGVRLTEAGRLLAARAGEILGRVQAAGDELAAHTGLRAGRVRLAAFPSALGTLVPTAAARLRAAHPELGVELSEVEPPEALELLRAGAVDAAVIFRYATEPDQEDLRLDRLDDEPVHLVGPTGADWPAELAEHAEADWIAGCERCRNHLVQLCADAGFTPRIRFTTDDYVAAQALVAAGLGVTVLPDLALRAYRRPGVRTRELPGARRQIMLARYGRPPDPPAVRALAAALTTPGAPAGRPRR